MKDAEKRVVAAKFDRDALSALSTSSISGRVRTSVTETDDKLNVVTEVTMTPGQVFTYTELSDALRIAAGPDASITQRGKTGAVIRWSNR